VDSDRIGLLEFVVHSVEHNDGRTSIVGRNGHYAVQRGEVLTMVYSRTVKDDGDTIVSSAPQNVTTVELKVDLIRAYGRSLTQLDAGLTGELTLSGSESDRHLLSEGVIVARRLDEVTARRRR
jgi:hypothetical protein